MGRVRIHYPAVGEAGQLEMDVLSTVQVTSLINMNRDSAFVEDVPFTGGWKASDYKQLAVSMRGSATVQPIYSSSTVGSLGPGFSSGDSKTSWMTKTVGKGETKTITFTDEETMLVSIPYGRTVTMRSNGTLSLSWKFPIGTAYSIAAATDESGIVSAVNDTGNGVGVYYRGDMSNVSLTLTLYGIRE